MHASAGDRRQKMQIKIDALLGHQLRQRLHQRLFALVIGLTA
jgi:hypothetical protein